MAARRYWRRVASGLLGAAAEVDLLLGVAAAAEDDLAAALGVARAAAS